MSDSTTTAAGTTRWQHYVAYFFGGAFLANTIPHFVSGVTGHAFQSPFASPPGEGLSSSMVNVLWGSFNLAVGYVLAVASAPSIYATRGTSPSSGSVSWRWRSCSRGRSGDSTEGCDQPRSSTGASSVKQVAKARDDATRAEGPHMGQGGSGGHVTVTHAQ
jgi:hypothetical protein